MHAPLLVFIFQTGYTVKYHKEAVPGSAVIFVRPIKSDLTMDIIKKDGIKLHSQRVNCHENIPLFEMKEHSEVCKGGSSSCTQEYLTAFPQKDETSATQSLSTIVLDSDMPGNDNEVLPSHEERAAWITKLQEIFPNCTSEVSCGRSGKNFLVKYH